MADEEKQAEQPAQAEQPIDWEARYRAAVEHSREWERKAKANKGAADELARAQEAGKAAEERIAELTRSLDEKERAEARAKVAAKVAAAKGVPADLLVGDTEEDMAAWADRMRAALAPRAAPRVDSPGAFARDEPSGDEGMRGVLRQLFPDRND